MALDCTSCWWGEWHPRYVYPTKVLFMAPEPAENSWHGRFQQVATHSSNRKQQNFASTEVQLDSLEELDWILRTVTSLCETKNAKLGVCCAWCGPRSSRVIKQLEIPFNFVRAIFSPDWFDWNVWCFHSNRCVLASPVFGWKCSQCATVRF